MFEPSVSQEIPAPNLERYLFPGVLYSFLDFVRELWRYPFVSVDMENPLMSERYICKSPVLVRRFITSEQRVFAGM